jgi:amino acid adenylation domain-containing protein
VTVASSLSQSGADAYDRYYILPASFGQERLWFLTRLDVRADVGYHLCAGVRLIGELDRLRLQRALDHVVRQQESLRTGVAFIDGSLQQIVLPAASLAVPTVDLGGLPRERQRLETERLAASVVRMPFALDDPPLVRLVLISLSEREHVLLVVLHHLVADGWSVGILLQEVTGAYVRLVRGLPEPPEPAVQYADYVVWQREQSATEHASRSLSYWLQQLSGVPPLDLPTDLPRPASRSGGGAICRLSIDAALTTRAEQLGRERQATLFMVLMAAFEAVLGRVAGQDDFAVGTAVANRPVADVEGLIGLFANTLALRADLRGDPTVVELLGRVRGACLGAYEHQELPFERLVEELRPVRDLSRTPVFQVMLVLQEALPEVGLPGLAIGAPLELDAGTARFDLALTASRSGGGLRLALEHDTALFEPATAEFVLDAFSQVLAAMCDRPDERVSDLPLTAGAAAPAEAGTPADEPAGTAGALIAATAARTPGAIAVAVADGTSELTYASLVERVGALAARLAADGVRPGDLVAVCLPRSADLVAALLAVWRAGAAYVPLDPGYPPARVAHMIEHSGVRVVVTTSTLAAELPLAGHGVVLLPDAGPPAPASAAPAPCLDGPAYVIYTSGSTGPPKGVVVGHRSFAHHLQAMRGVLGLTCDDVLVAVTSVSFDIAGLELFLPLLCGARLVLAPADVAADGERLAALLQRSGATAMQGTPASWRLLLAAGWSPPPGFRVLCGGEALDAALARRLWRPDAELWNLYGPTEATVWASVARVGDPDRVCLGRPLPGTSRCLLDSRLRPVPRGAVGELYLGGACAATGYLGAPSATAERFLPDPFASTPGARMYRTGDLCRYDPDGGLRFRRRADDQVKIRGFRVEPGEVEAVLAADDRVRQVAVVATRLSDDDVRLVAHVVPVEGDDGALVAALRAQAVRRLPAQAVPATINVLQALPLTPAGKVDRRALAALPLPRPTTTDGEGPAEPRTRAERAVARIFAGVLGLPQVDLFGSFFDLGGHSLLAAKLVGRIRDELDVAVSVRALFENPTVEGLAAAMVEGETRGGADDAAPARGLVERLSDQEVDALLRSMTKGGTE